LKHWLLELEQHSVALLQKPRLLVLSKIDAVGGELPAAAAALAKEHETLVISAVTGMGLASLVARLGELVVAAATASAVPWPDSPLPDL
jgi:50S ribosomal subunit-associated GTPase HflX